MAQRPLRMRILIATFTYFPNIDGVAEAARYMADNFLSAGHEVSIATGPEEVPTSGNFPNTAHVSRFRISGTPTIGGGFKGEIREYIEFIRKYDPDLIVFHGWDTWPVEIVLPVLADFRSKTVLLSHGYSAHMMPSLCDFPRGYMKWFRWLPHVLKLPSQLKAFDKVVFLSRKIDVGRFFDELVAKLIGCVNTTIIPNSSATDWKCMTPNFREKFDLRMGILFLCVANYATRKNQSMALDAYCKANIPGSALVFIGSLFGEYGRKVQERWSYIEENYPDLRVCFLEKVARIDIVSAYKACDVFVLSATAETQPIVILEAMACGKPYISTDTGCVSSLDGGIVVKDTADMARQMLELARNPAFREDLGRRGRAHFERYCAPETTRRAWLDLVDDVVNDRESRPSA